MAKTKEKPKISETISAFNALTYEARAKYNFAMDKLEDLHNVEMNLNHSLELEGRTKGERAKSETLRQKMLLERRLYKDIVEEYEPLIQFLDDDKNTKTINTLRNVLGEVQKRERYHENRVYIPRAIKDKVYSEFMRGSKAE